MAGWMQFVAVIFTGGNGSILTLLVQWHLKRRDHDVQKYDESSGALTNRLLKEIGELRDRVTLLEQRVDQEKSLKHDALGELQAKTLRCAELERENARLQGQIEAMQGRLQR